MQASTIVSVRASPSTKQGAISARIAASSTASPARCFSASVASSAEPTSVTSQSRANERTSAWVYSRATVASVPSTEMRLVSESAQAGLIAGTVPTKGRAKRSRSAGSTSVEAVLQATITRSGRCAAISRSISAVTRAISACSSTAA